MLSAFVRLSEERPSGAANVLMSCTVDEEYTKGGAEALASSWDDPELTSDIHRRPDVAIVAEPTALDVVVAHKDVIRWHIVTKGRACHSSQPTQGINAIYRMGHVLRKLETYAQNLPVDTTAHPLCGSPTLSIGMIDGGISVNTVPDRCSIQVDRRVIPGEDPRTARADVECYLRAELDFEFEMTEPWVVGTPLGDDANLEWADRLLRHSENVDGSHEKIGVPYGTNAAAFSAQGVPSLVFGPGSIDQAHTKDEWVSLSQVRQAEEVYFKFCASGGR